MKQRIVLACSGGLNAAAAIPWLAVNHGGEVVAVTLDLGQGREVEDVRERALAAGAVRAHVLDVREELAREYVLPSLQAGAMYAGRDCLASALGRPLIARKLLEVAGIEHADAVAHGCRDDNHDRARFESLLASLDPRVPIIATAMGPPPPAGAGWAVRDRAPAGAVRADTNLWGRSIGGDAPADASQELPESIYAITRSAAAAPATPAYVEISLARGVPAAVNGVPMGLGELIESVATIAGEHGVGRTHGIAHRPDGTPSRWACEAPAATVLHAAYAGLESLVCPEGLRRVKDGLRPAYADLIHDGSWFTATRIALDAFNATVQARVTGVIRLKLYKGSCVVVGQTAVADPQPVIQHSPFAIQHS